MGGGRGGKLGWGGQKVGAFCYGLTLSSVAASEVVVDEAHGLHEGVGGGGADEGPAASFEVLTEGDGLGGGGEGSCLGPSDGGFAAGGLESEEVGVEGFELGEEVEGAVGVVDGGKDFAAMANDAGIEDEAFDVDFVKLGNFVEVEVGKGGTEVFAFAKDGEPGESGLESFEADFFEEADVVGHSPAPFLVVVSEIFGIVSAPPAAGFAIGAGEEAVMREDHRGHTEERRGGSPSK